MGVVAVTCESKPSRRGRILFLLWVGLLVVLLPGFAHAQRGARVLHRNLAELVDDAYTIVVGRVLSVKAEPHPKLTNLSTIVVTLRVSEVLKGKAGGQFTFRQFINDSRDQTTRLGYKPGQDVLLMMTKPSQYGLSSPAGLEQGRFRLVPDAQGNRTVANGFNNLGLFRNIEKKAPKFVAQLGGPMRKLVTQHRGGPIPYNQLRNLIRELFAAQSE